MKYMQFSDPFLSDLNELREVSEVFEPDTGIEERDRRLVELNVLAQIYWTMKQPIVMKAVRERDMKVHGFVYDLVQRSCVRLEITSPTKVA
jgi:carbonic anhydrase